LSSLAAARADNFYHPPDWDPRKHSRAEHNAGGGHKLSKEDKWKAHPLRDRAKKLATEGVLTIRFEMPFNVRCHGCDNHIGKGVRYNAEKKTIGKYFSTSIYSFRMLCHCEDGTSRTCQRRNPHWIEIHTDPKNADYVIVEGATRIAEPSADDAESLGVERTLDPTEAAKRSANPFYRLETTSAAAQRKPWLTRLQDQRDDRWQDDYEANRALRRAHRALRKDAAVEAASHEAKGIRVSLADEQPSDLAIAREAPLQAVRRASDLRCGERRQRVVGGSIFGSQYASTACYTSASLAMEKDRLRGLSIRRRRGMQITASLAPPHRESSRPPQLLLTTASRKQGAERNQGRQSAEEDETGRESREESRDIPHAAVLCAETGLKRARSPSPQPRRVSTSSNLVAYSDTDSDSDS